MHCAVTYWLRAKLELVSYKNKFKMDCMSMDMKKQLMEMAGITDVAEFDNMAQKIAGKAMEVTKPPKVPHSPFQGM